MGRVLWDFNQQFADRLPQFMVYADPANPADLPHLYLPWQMIIYLTAALAAMVGVSLVTKPPEKEKLDRVYETLRTPVRAGEPEVEPLTLPEGTRPAPRSVLIDHPDFEITKPSRESVIGFLATWIAVGLLIAAFVWIIK